MTKQIGEILEFKGNEYFLDICLLEPYFKNNPNKKPKGEIESCMWNGYFADYVIVNNEFLIRDICISKKGNYKSVLKDVFPNSKQMIWLNKLVLINLNNKPKSNKGIEKQTETLKRNYIIFQIKNGVVTEQRKYSATELDKFKIEQFEYFKMLPEYEILKTEYQEKQIENYKTYSKKNKEKHPEFNINEFDQYVLEYIIENYNEFIAD